MVVSIVLLVDLDAEAGGNLDGGLIWARPQASSARRIVHPTNSCHLTSHPSIQSTFPARKPTNSPRRAHYEGRYSRRCLRMALLVGTTQRIPDSVVTGNGSTATGLQKRPVFFSLLLYIPSTQCAALHSTSSFLLCYDLVIPSNGAVVDRLVSFCLLFISMVVL